MSVASCKARISRPIHCSLSSKDKNDLAELKEFGRLALARGLAKLNRARLYLCGDPTVGKTTLAGSLNFGQLPPHAAPGKSTQGISVFTADLAPSAQPDSSPGALFSVWDFAGQQDYHVSHSLFVEPEAAVFLVLCDLTKGVAAVEKQARYWLRYICTQTGRRQKPQVVLVGTHADLAPLDADQVLELDDNAAQISADFSARLDVNAAIVCLDARSPSIPAVSHLRERLVATHRNLQQRATMSFPQVCIDAAKALEQYRKADPATKLCSFEQFAEAIDSALNQVAKADRASITRSIASFLHQMGEIYFDPSGPLGDQVVLDVGWLCGSVLGWMFCPLALLDQQSRITIRKLNNAAGQGPVPEAAAVAALESCLDGAIDGKLAIDVLAGFKLCFRMPSSSHVLFPALLRTIAPQGVWEHDDRLQHHVGRVYSCEDPLLLVPPGLFPQIQVQLLEKFPIDAQTWHGGIVVNSNNAQACLTVSDDGLSLKIHVRAHKAGAGRKMLRSVESVVRTSVHQHEGLHMVQSLCRLGDLKGYKSMTAQSSVLVPSILGLNLQSCIGADTVAELLGFTLGKLFITASTHTVLTYCRRRSCWNRFAVHSCSANLADRRCCARAGRHRAARHQHFGQFASIVGCIASRGFHAETAFFEGNDCRGA